MVFLHQDGIKQSDTMIGATAADYGIFLCPSEAWQGFARVQNYRSRAGDGINVVAGARGSRGQRLQKIQTAPLAGQNTAGGSVETADFLLRFHQGTIIQRPIHADSRIHLTKCLIEPWLSGQYGSLTANNPGLQPGVFRYQARRAVAAADVFGQGGFNVMADDGGVRRRSYSRHITNPAVEWYRYLFLRAGWGCCQPPGRLPSNPR